MSTTKKATGKRQEVVGDFLVKTGGVYARLYLTSTGHYYLDGHGQDGEGSREIREISKEQAESLEKI